MELPEKNKTFEFEKNNNHFSVSNKGNNVYILRCKETKFRVRWGNKKEITEDINYIMENGILPKSKNRNWF
jgi:hypothetical protein